MQEVRWYSFVFTKTRIVDEADVMIYDGQKKREDVEINISRAMCEIMIRDIYFL